MQNKDGETGLFAASSELQPWSRIYTDRIGTNLLNMEICPPQPQCCKEPVSPVFVLHGENIHDLRSFAVQAEKDGIASSYAYYTDHMTMKKTYARAVLEGSVWIGEPDWGTQPRCLQDVLG